MSTSFAEAFKKNGIEFKPLLEDYINFSDIKITIWRRNIHRFQFIHKNRMYSENI